MPLPVIRLSANYDPPDQTHWQSLKHKTYEKTLRIDKRFIDPLSPNFLFWKNFIRSDNYLRK